MEMTIRDMTPAEREYAYPLSRQLTGQTGCIGRLRAYVAETGSSFDSDWDDYYEEIKAEDFKREINEVVKNLRFGKQYRHLLQNCASMSAWCQTHPGANFGDGSRYFGFRVNTPKYTYMLRLDPRRGEYNLYCYCYIREWLDTHMKRAEKGIRFITPHYSDRFTVRDGEHICVIHNDGTRQERTCRYIDDSHMELDGTVYRVWEFAEMMENEGSTVIPYRESLPGYCYSVDTETTQLIRIWKGDPAIRQVTEPLSYDNPRQAADRLNEKLGISRAQEAAMLAGVKFGWCKPAADPKNYDASGNFMKLKNKERGDER